MARRLLPIIDFAHGSDVAGKQSPDGRHKEYLEKWVRCWQNVLNGKDSK